MRPQRLQTTEQNRPRMCNCTQTPAAHETSAHEDGDALDPGIGVREVGERRTLVVEVEEEEAGSVGQPAEVDGQRLLYGALQCNRRFSHVRCTRTLYSVHIHHISTATIM